MFSLRFNFILFLLFFFNCCFSQDTLGYENILESNQPIAPLLKDMSHEDKLKTLDYMRYLGSNIDDELQAAFDQISTQDQQKALQFMYTQMKAAIKTKVFVSRDTIDLGIIEEGRTKLDSFIITNRGVNPYLIFSTKTACDCSVLRLPTYPIKPNESSTIFVEFDSTQKEGPFNIGLVVYDNSTPNARQIVYLKGNVKRRAKKR
jgi:hypothetical protein